MKPIAGILLPVFFYHFHRNDAVVVWCFLLWNLLGLRKWISWFLTECSLEKIQKNVPSRQIMKWVKTYFCFLDFFVVDFSYYSVPVFGKDTILSELQHKICICILTRYVYKNLTLLCTIDGVFALINVGKKNYFSKKNCDYKQQSIKSL